MVPCTARWASMTLVLGCAAPAMAPAPARLGNKEARGISLGLVVLPKVGGA